MDAKPQDTLAEDKSQVSLVSGHFPLINFTAQCGKRI